DWVNAGVNRFGDLAFRLRDAVHLNLVGAKSGLQSAKELTAGIDFDINSRFAHYSQHAEDVIGLRRVAEFDLFMMARGFEQPRDVMSNARGRDDEQRRIELFRESDGVNPVDMESVVVNFQVARNCPGWLRRGTFSH